jgi:Septum formation
VSDDRPEPPGQDPYATAPLPPPYAAPPSPYATPSSPYAAPVPPVPPPTDVVSVVALVTSVIGALVAAVPLGIIGLVRTKGRRRGGRWAAVTALALSAAWVVVGIVVFALLGSSTTAGTALGGASASPTPSSLLPTGTPSPVVPTATPTPTPTPTATVKPAKVVTHSEYIGFVTKGHCFNEPKKGSSFVPELTTCRAPHDEEMMGTVQLGSGGYPGTTVARRKADTACQKLFTSFVGVSTGDSDLGLETWWPSAGLWGSGQHAAQCAVRDPDGKTVGTLRGARR